MPPGSQGGGCCSGLYRAVRWGGLAAASLTRAGRRCCHYYHYYYYHYHYHYYYYHYHYHYYY